MTWFNPEISKIRTTVFFSCCEFNYTQVLFRKIIGSSPNSEFTPAPRNQLQKNVMCFFNSFNSFLLVLFSKKPWNEFQSQICKPGIKLSI